MISTQFHDGNSFIKAFFICPIGFFLSPEMARDGVARVVGITFPYPSIGFDNIQFVSIDASVDTGESPKCRPSTGCRLGGKPTFEITGGFCENPSPSIFTDDISPELPFVLALLRALIFK